MWDNSHGITIKVNIMANSVCACFGSNGFMTRCSHSLMDSHYRTYIINGVGHLRSDSVVTLVLCTITYNIRGTGVVLQVHWDSTNPSKKR
jgi:hypothetical protein